jgi:hypothetical protein
MKAERNAGEGEGGTLMKTRIPTVPFLCAEETAEPEYVT